MGCVQGVQPELGFEGLLGRFGEQERVGHRTQGFGERVGADQQHRHVVAELAGSSDQLQGHRPQLTAAVLGEDQDLLHLSLPPLRG